MAAYANTVKVVAAVAAVGVVAMVGAVVLLRGSDDGASSPTPPVTSTPAVTVSPAATATPGAGSLSPREQAEVFALEPLPGVVELVRLAAGETVAENYGFYFMNVETGAVDGWRHIENDPLPNTLGFSGDYRFAGFSYRASLEPAVRRAKLADRKTGALYGWQGDAELVYAEGNLRNVRRGEAGSSGEVLASSGDRVLFRIEDPEDGDWFILVAMDPEPKVVSTFQAEGYMALLSTDGRQAVVFGESTWLVDIDNGTVQSLDADPPDFDGAFALRNIPGADAFLLSLSATDPDGEGAWLRYSWQGEKQQGASGAFRVYPSVDGEFVATAETFPGSDGQNWPAMVTFNAVSTENGTGLFRAVGAIESFGYTTGNIWLADGSGVVLSDPSFEMMVALQNGAFLPYVGMPSPVDASVFASTSPVEGGQSPILGPTVFDSDGNVLAQTTASARSFIPPWGLTGSEIRFIVPHGGHGGIGFARSLVEPRVDQPPYQNALSLSLASSAVGMALLDSPPNGSAVGTLGTDVVTVLQTQRVRLESSSPGYERYCNLLIELGPGFERGCSGFPLWGQWAQVIPAGGEIGEQGWLLIAVNPEGN
ncbi:MAG: hypothetical protein IH609_04755 [Dehalococcoidia bacterium]|nr:hypothetical protein [Dehalococcoidia bacterium]